MRSSDASPRVRRGVVDMIAGDDESAAASIFEGDAGGEMAGRADDEETMADVLVDLASTCCLHKFFTLAISRTMLFM